MGRACLAPNGLLAIFTETGDFLGYTHGPDPAPPTLSSLAPAVPPACTHTDTDYATQVILAFAQDDSDDPESRYASIRQIVAQATGIVWRAGYDTGVEAFLRFTCTTWGQVDIQFHRLNVPRDSATFAGIKAELLAAGHRSATRKYLVFYDDFLRDPLHPNTCGLGELFDEPDPSAANPNNSGPMFAAVWCYSAQTALHELTHTMGAVLSAAEHTTGPGYGHCNDGQDVMCYADGGPRSNYNPGVCSQLQYDCNHDDYFNTAPPWGSRLSTTWNVGGADNNFLAFGVRRVASLDCPPSSELDEEIVCFVRAGSGSGQVSYAIDWGDGSAPSTAAWRADVPRPFEHTYRQPGIFTITARASGSDGTDYLPRSASINVQPNELMSLTCPSSVSVFASFSCNFQAGVEGDQDVYYTVNWGDGSLPARVPETGTQWAFVEENASHAYSRAATFIVTVSATDTEGRTTAPRSVSVTARPDATPPDIGVRAPTGFRIGGYVYDGLDHDHCGVRFALSPSPYSTFLGQGCIEADINDAGSGVSQVSVRLVTLPTDLLEDALYGDVQGYCCAHKNVDGYWVMNLPLENSAPLGRIDILARDRAGNVVSCSIPVSMISYAESGSILDDPLPPASEACRVTS